MTFEKFFLSPVGFLCCVFFALFVVVYWFDLFRRLDEAQKLHDEGVNKCHRCGQRLRK